MYGPFLAQIISVNDIAQLFHPSFYDLLDIAVIAIVFFFILKFLIETRLTVFFFSVLGLSLLYGLSLLLDLPLSHQVISSLFGTFLVIIAVASQRELRRFFSFYGSFNLPHRRKTLSEPLIDEISVAIFTMAKKKMGALLVFPGRESIDRLLDGGISIHGDISLPLILSIFDTSTPGHDGAMIIESNKIKSFGVQLPLAEGNLTKVKNFGLRHRAALGLAERSDALVIVISEEKGTIHTAWNGKLSPITGKEELSSVLAKFYAANFPEPHTPGFFWWSLRNGAYFLVALFAALVLWALSNSGLALVQRNFLVAPEFKNVNAQFIVSNVSPSNIEVYLEGRSFSFDSLNTDDLLVTVDLNGISSAGWHRIDIAPGDVHIPLSFSVVNLSPGSIEVDLIHAPTNPVITK